MNVSSALVMVFGVCVGAAVASTMGLLVLPDSTSTTSKIELQKSMSLPVAGIITSVSPDSFLLTEENNGASKAITVHYDNNTSMFVRTVANDQQGVAVSARLVQTEPEKILKKGLRVRVTLWLSPKNTVPYAMIIYTSPTQ